MIGVAFPVYNRPHLLNQVLEAWSKVRGVEDALLEFACEPGSDACIALCEEVDFAERRVTVNEVRLGHAANTARVMGAVFERTDYAILGLDDFLPSTDLLELHAWHRARYLDDYTVLCMASGRDVPAADADPASVWRCQLMGALSGHHRYKWDMLAAAWDQATDQGWWPWVNSQWLQSGPRFDVLFPSLSRAEDIGDHHPATCFLADPPAQEYFEVRGLRERSTGFTRRVEAWDGPSN